MRKSVRATFGAFLRRDLQVALSYRVPFVLEFAAIAFTVLTYTFVSKLISPDRVPGGYFAFVLLGMTVAAFMDAGVSVLGANLRQEQVQGTLEALLASGVPVSGLASGMAAYPLVQSTWTAAIYLAIGWIAGARAGAEADWPLAFAAVLLGAVSFVGIGLIGAALVLLFRRAAAATGWMVAVLSLAGGEFFPPGLLPGWFRTLSVLSPFTQTLRLTRAALLESAGWASSAGRLGLLAAMALVWVGLGVWALTFGLHRARRTGSLSQY